MNDNCKKLVAHLSRIQGQINALKGYLENEKDCREIVNLSLSIGKSFDSFKCNLFEAYMEKELLDNGKVALDDLGEVKEFLRLVRK